MTKMKTTLVKESEIEVYDEEYEGFVLNEPAKFSVKLATGDILFLHCRSRSEAQQFVDSEYGKGFYTVRQHKQGSGSGEYSASGTTSRRGTASHLKRSA